MVFSESFKKICAGKFYDELLQKDNSVRVHHRNQQFLATEIFKVKNVLDPNIMKEVFQFRELLYNLRSKMSIFLTRKVRTTYGLNSMIYLAARICEQVPEAVRCCSSLKKIKN